MSPFSSHWKYLFIMLSVCALLITGLATSITVTAEPASHTRAAELKAAPSFEIVDHEPVTHEIGVDVTANITGIFDAPVDASTISTATWVVYGRLSGVLTGTYSTAGNKVIFDPYRPYLTGELVNVIATSGISSTGGLPLSAQQFSYEAGPVQPRCTGGFSEDITASSALTDVEDALAAWGDYDNDGDSDLLLTGFSSSDLVTKLYRNEISDGGTFSETTVGVEFAGIYWGSVAWGDYDNDSDLDILLTGKSYSGPVTKIYRNDMNSSGVFTETDVGAGLTDVQQSSAAWGDYDNDGDLDILLTGEDGGRVAKIYRNDVKSSGVFTEATVGAGLNGVSNSSVAWGDYDNDGYLDILLTGDDPGRVTEIYHNEVNTGGVFVESGAVLSDVMAGAVAWGDYDNDGDLDILLTGEATSNEAIAKVYRNDVNSGGGFSDIGAGLTGVYMSSVAWGDYDNDGDLDILLTGKDSSSRFTKVYRNDGSAGGLAWIFTDINADLTDLSHGTATWSDYDNDDDLDILLVGSSSSGPIAKLYRNDDCGDLEITKQTSMIPVDPGATVAYTISFVNSGESDVVDTTITDSLPTEFTLKSVDVSTTGITKFGQVSDAPTLVWLSSDMPPGAGGTILLTGVIEDSLQDVVFVRNAVTATTKGPELSLANNSAQATVTVHGPAELLVKKVVVGPVPATGSWTYIGSPHIGLFQVPAGGGGKTFTLTADSYTLAESVVPDYVASVSCSTGDTGGNLVQFSLTVGEQETCTFTNTFSAHTLSVSSVGGSVVKQPDQAAYAHGTVVMLTAVVDTGWTFAGWSGDADGSANPLAMTMNDSKAVTAVFTQNGGIVKGSVIDESGNGIADVVVILNDGANIAQATDAAHAMLVLPDTTDAEGNYRFEGVQAGTYTLTFIAHGYLAPDPISVDVSEGSTKTVDSVVMLEDTVDTLESVYLPAIER